MGFVIYILDVQFFSYFCYYHHDQHRTCSACDDCISVLRSAFVFDLLWSQLLILFFVCVCVNILNFSYLLTFWGVLRIFFQTSLFHIVSALHFLIGDFGFQYFVVGLNIPWCWGNSSGLEGNQLFEQHSKKKKKKFNYESKDTFFWFW